MRLARVHGLVGVACLVLAAAAYAQSTAVAVPDNAPVQAAPLDEKPATWGDAKAGQSKAGACAACHHDGNGPKLLGINIPLALNSNLHSPRPDNLLQVIVHGIREPATRDIGFMPGFGHALSDAQITELAGYMRQRYAPGRPAWRDVPEALARVRAGPAHP